MARVFIEGFEDNTLGRWIIAGLQTPVIETSQFSASGLSLKMPGYLGSTVDHILPAASSYYFAFKTKLGNAYSSTDSWFFHTLSYPSYLISLRVDNNGIIYVGNNGVTVATFTLAGWTNEHRFEVFVDTNSGGSAGQVIVKVDGVVAASANGLTMLGSTIDRIRLQGQNLENTLIDHNHFDDIIVDDSAWPGATMIQLLTVTGNGTTNNWTCSSGSDHHVLVDEIPPSDTDYVYTDTVNNYDLYALSDFVEPVVGIPWKIKCVQLQPRAAYEGVSPVQTIQPIVRTGGTVYPTDGSGTLAITTTMADMTKIFESNPATGISWTIPEVDAIEIGVKAKA